jgi:uridine kinase
MLLARIEWAERQETDCLTCAWRCGLQESRGKTMKIEIQLQPQIDADIITREVEAGILLEDLVNQYRSRLPYTVVAALVDNRVETLSYVLEKPCTIRFLDMRNNAADRIYQRSLCLVYLKAIDDVLGHVDTDILNSLNRGLFTRIHSLRPVTDAHLAEIEGRMWHIVDENRPIERTMVQKRGLLQRMEDVLPREKLELLKSTPDVHFIAVYTLDGYVNYFYGPLTPSTRYLQHFELHRYEDGILLRYPHPAFPGALPPNVNDRKIFEAFDEGWEIGRTAGLSFISDLNNEIDCGKTEEIIQLSERFHSAKIRRITKAVRDTGKRVVLIAGPSSSGKTTFAKRLSATLKAHGEAPLYLGTDDYFLERENTPRDEKGEPNFEGPDAIDVGLFNRNIGSLLAGEETDLPIFNFLTGKKEFGKRKTRLAAGQVIVIEGIHALNIFLTEQIADEEKYRIYISPLSQLNMDDHNRIPTTDVRLIRRIVRDHRTRGISVTDTIRTWPKVRRGEEINIFPYNGDADIVFNSALIYELSALRPHCESLLAEVDPEQAEFGDASRLLDFLRFFRPIENESPIPGDSILREFIGGGTIE